MLSRDRFHMKEKRVALIKMLIENVLKLLPLKLVIMNEFGATFLRIKNE